ncbi:MAG: tryptophan synthase subunit alpha [Gammaproteobacteria bacterium]|tara:strand:- start:1210 stop:1989 length:780 start_codon:yes stop_codon:yes gene_type:complete
MQNNNLLPLINVNKTAFIPYLVAGHTNNEVFTAALQLLDDLGADLIEIGIPFTDPIAEGKIIESAHHHALKNNFKLDDLCKIVSKFRSNSDTPVIAMGYTNSFINPSPNQVAKKLSENGFNGVLIVDLPASEKSIIRSFKEEDLEIIQLIAPTTQLNLIESFLDNDPALIYYITQRGITGSNNLNLTEISQKLNTLKNLTNKPVVTGFGIKTEKDINDLKGLSDGIVIGSPIVEKINADPSLKELQKYVEPIVKAIKNE